MKKTIYEMMTDKIQLKGSVLIPKLFNMIADQKEAELLMQMPGSVEELADSTGKPVSKVDDMCRQLYIKGLAFKSTRNGCVKYKMCRDLIQFHDGTILWPDAPKAYHDLWQRFMEEEWPEFARMITSLIPKAFTRVIAVEEAVEAGKQQVLDLDSVNKIIEKSNTLAVTKCTCRVIAHKCDMPLEACIQIDNAAKYTLDRGTGREITKDEAYNLIVECEEKGLVHVTMNKAHVGHFICNCCKCCCQAMPLLISEKLNLTAPSRFSASVDVDTCTGCGTCVDRCMFKAIYMENEIAYVNKESCLGCGLCNVTCPVDSIKLHEVRPVAFVPE